jgi:YbbR domain-containing protein
MTVTSEIELKSIPDDLVVVRPHKREVKVTIKGPSFLVGSVAADPPPFRVSLSNVGQGPVTAQFVRSDINLPAAVDLVSVEPAEMVFEIEAVESREVRVDVPRIGQLPKNLTLESVAVNPPVVTVRGARSAVRAIRSVETKPLSLGEIEEAKHFELDLDLRSPTGKVSVSHRSVAVAVHVGAVVSQREFGPRVVEVRTAPDLGPVLIEPTSVRVVLSGPTHVLASIDPTALVPFVRIQRAPETKGSELSVQLDSLPNVTVVRIEPPVVKAFRGIVGALKPKGVACKR